MFRMMILLAALLAVTGGFAPASAIGATQAPQVHVIVVDKMQYGPMPTEVHAGDVIEWTNKDILEHSATARDGRFDIDLKPGTSGRITATAGTLVFFCKFHPTMTATLVVK
jgi:plastocyanin